MQGGLALHRNCIQQLSYYYHVQFWLWWLCMVIHWGGYSVHCKRAWFRQPSHCTKSIIKLNREPFSAWTSPDHDDDDNTDAWLKSRQRKKWLLKSLESWGPGTPLLILERVVEGQKGAEGPTTTTTNHPAYQHHIPQHNRWRRPIQ